jgi:hypothetical protein
MSTLTQRVLTAVQPIPGVAATGATWGFTGRGATWGLTADGATWG